VVSSGSLADPTTIYSGGSETISKGGTDLGAHRLLHVRELQRDV
jgi:hypothetical protein